MSSIFGGSTRSHHRHKSPSKVYIRPSASRSVPSLFGSSTSKHHSHSRSHSPSASSIFPRGLFGSSSKHHSSSSSYRRRPRDGYIAYLVAKLKRLVLDLWRYARRHPMKTFLAVVVPLISAGGAIGALLRSLGIGGGLLAAFGQGGGGAGGARRSGGGYYGSQGYEGDAMGTIGQVMKIAQAFV
ncbi:hypothetical protein K461DRAFT_289285 [Myriangium duriaei CBS 260.36]|uniref:Uncharacterized protein n=1 Tax=Myriangium duriaei CBS 260.36 TaxID=1168546 RepID=A0A9P4JDB4_9PEZI|nr:hypothetical protein K461DRAFT_289285 [Myriangium duriaei CBS 260.36]